MQTEQLNYIPIFMQTLLAVGFVAGTILISGKLGPKRSSKTKDKNFECGIESIGNARRFFLYHKEESFRVGIRID
jgi:NADH-quinone oxidoreductase subunit A